MFWIPTVIFLAHIAEEFPRFADWATRHFGATSQAWYVYSHVLLVAMTVTISVKAGAAAPRSVWPMLATTVQCALATNALFHIATTFLFREYSPGVVTGVLLSLPATAYMLTRLAGADLLTPFQLASAAVLGTSISAAIVASLWLRMDFDWRFRRPERLPRERAVS